MKNESNNIETHLSDTGDHACNAARPHAVASTANGPLGAQTYAYDANGNLTAGAGRAYEWTAANKMKKVTQGGQWTRFAFDADRQRVMQTREDGTVTTYIGDDYEKVEHPNGLIEKKHYIMTPLGRTAVRTVRSDGGIETRYFHADGLGTIHAVSDEWGQVEKRYYYDAWGKQMEVEDTHAASGGGRVTRGFTDHEMLDDFGLIHMNARLYDPTIGRFISADRFVQDIGNSQTYNRYSYCANNPVNTFDPTGNNFWDWLGGLWDSLFGSSDEAIEQQKAEATPSSGNQTGPTANAGVAGAASNADASAQTGSVANPSATQGIAGANAQNSAANNFAVIAVSSAIKSNADKYKFENYKDKKREDMTQEEKNIYDDRLIISYLESYQQKRSDYMKRANISGNIFIGYYSNHADLEKIIDSNVNDKTKVVRTINHAGRHIGMGDGTTVDSVSFENALKDLVKFKNIDTQELRSSADTNAVYCRPGYPRNVSEVDTAIHKALLECIK